MATAPQSTISQLPAFTPLEDITWPIPEKLQQYVMDYDLIQVLIPLRYWKAEGRV